MKIDLISKKAEEFNKAVPGMISALYGVNTAAERCLNTDYSCESVHVLGLAASLVQSNSMQLSRAGMFLVGATEEELKEVDRFFWDWLDAYYAFFHGEGLEELAELSASPQERELIALLEEHLEEL